MREAFRPNEVLTAAPQSDDRRTELFVRLNRAQNAFGEARRELMASIQRALEYDGT